MSVVRAAGHIFFVLLALLCLYFTAKVCAGVLQQVGEPFVSFGHNDESFVHPVGLEVWGADARGMAPWDRIVAVNGELVFSGDMIRLEAFSVPVGSEVVYQVEGFDGSARFVSVPTRIFSPSDLIRSHASQALLGLAFCVIASLLYFLRPGTLDAWAFFIFFASVGVCMTSIVNDSMLWLFPSVFPYVAPYVTCAGLVLVGALSKAFVWRRDNDRVGTLLKRLMYVVAVGAFTLASFIMLAFHFFRGNIQMTTTVGEVLYAWWGIGTLGGLVALFIAYQRGRSPRRRARIRQILWAIPVGAGIPTLNLFIGSVLELDTISFLWNGFVILLPIATADAIVRHDLLHLNKTARRLVGGITVAAVMGMGLGFVLWAAANFLSVNDAAGTVALAALLFAIAAPVNHRVQRHVESLLRSRRYKSGELLADFNSKASTETELAQVMRVLEDTLERSVRPGDFEVYALDKHSRTLKPLRNRRRSAVPVRGQVADLLSRAESSIFDDETPGPEPFGDVVMALRLAVANEPEGLMVLTPRADELAYEGGDVAFVESLAGPLSAALVNTRTYRAVQKLNRELEQRVVERTQELEQKNTELADLNARKDELVATVSHDFRSPLAIIRQNVQTIIRDLGEMEDEDLKMFLEAIGRQESRLANMCESLLDLAKLRNPTPPTSRVELRELVRELAEGFRVRAGQKGVALHLHLSAQPAEVRGDRSRLGQLIQNLLDNALKFTPEGGDVTLSVEPVDDADPHVDLVVADTGCGVPEESVHRLFDPFFQVPNPSTVGQGSGLGLAIVQAVVSAHDGLITVDSQPDEGTRFRVRLPKAASTMLPASTNAAGVG